MTPTPDRPGIDQITSDQLDQLYGELVEWKRQARAERSDCRIAEEESRRARQAEAEQRQRSEQLEDLLRIANDTSNTSEAERARAVERANRVEGERGDLLVKLAAVRADRDRWRDQARTEQADRRAAEATLTAVRELHDRWECDANVCAVCVDGYGNPVSYPCPTTRLLDQHGQTPA